VFIISLAVGCIVTYYPNKSMFTTWIFPGAMKKYLKAQQAAEELAWRGCSPGAPYYPDVPGVRDLG